MAPGFGKNGSIAWLTLRSAALTRGWHRQPAVQRLAVVGGDFSSPEGDCPMKHSVTRYGGARAVRHSVVALGAGLLAAGAGCDPGGDHAPGDLASFGWAATVSSEVIVTQPLQGPAFGRWPSAAFDGTQYLVVWEDLRAGRPIVYGARVGADGVALDGAGIPLMDLLPGTETIDVHDPVVAAGGEGFLVVTQAAGQIRGVRVSKAGEVLDPGGFAIATVDGETSGPALAFDGERYLVAWTRLRPRPTDVGGVYWARIDPDGTVLDPEGVRGFDTRSIESQAGVSFDGTNYLVSWGDDPEIGSRGVYAARVRTDGTAIDTAAFRVTPDELFLRGGVSPAAGFDGTNHVIVWRSEVDDESGGGEITVRVSRVSPQATVLDPDGIEVHREPEEATNVHRLGISAGNGRSVVTAGIHIVDHGLALAGLLQVAEVAANGAVTAHPADELGQGLDLTLTAHPAGGLMLWRDGHNLDDSGTHIVGMQLDDAGRPITGAPVTAALTASRQEVRAVASDGQIFFVVWSDTREPGTESRALYGTRVTTDGTPLDAEAIELTTKIADMVDVVFDGENFLVNWVHHTGGEGDGSPFASVRVSPAGELLSIAPEEPVLSSPDYTMAGASDGTHTLLVGDSWTSGLSALSTVLVDQQGAYASEIATIVPKERIERIDVYDPAVAFDGAGYLVVWHHGDQLLAQRVSRAGALVGGHIPIASGQTIYRSTVRAGGGTHLVVWQGQDGIFATRVSPDGAVLDPEAQLIASAAPMCSRPGFC